MFQLWKSGRYVLDDLFGIYSVVSLALGVGVAGVWWQMVFGLGLRGLIWGKGLPIWCGFSFSLSNGRSG